MLDTLFFPEKLTFENSDTYFIRKTILKAIDVVIPKIKGKLLDVGCGKMPYKDYILQNSQVKTYIGLDIEQAKVYDEQIKPDFIWNGVIMPFENASFDCAIATEVLEHCPDPQLFLKEVYRVLRPGGIFFITVPFLWNLHEVPNDEYRFTPFSLERHLKAEGFNNIHIKASGGWHAAMAQMLGLWIRRSPMANSKRSLLFRILKPIIGYLIKLDKHQKITFIEGQMITGLYAIVNK